MVPIHNPLRGRSYVTDSAMLCHRDSQTDTRTRQQLLLPGQREDEHWRRWRQRQLHGDVRVRNAA